MTLSDRTRDFLVAGVFMAVVAGLLAVGWADGRGGEPFDPRAGMPLEGLETGSRAPSLELPRLNGGTATLASLRGRPVIVNIWATWCPPCVREMPSLQRVYERFGGQGLEILAVAVDDVPGVEQPDGRVEGIVSRFVDEYGLTFPVLLDPTGTTERRYGTEYLPTTVLIDRRGRIVAAEIGGREWDRPPYLDMIEALMEEG
ncbi:MAG: TlpA disulfide reductase family protein [Longimicrobiales bacterium]|nr:TlpA disulfide reductase family protein [Longimicrobiales bacterium]